MYKIKSVIFALLIFTIPVTASCILFVPVENQEKVVLTTDRSIYIVGEQVHFVATLTNGNVSNSTGQSQILYCEIIAPDGNKIADSKFLISNATASGCIDIPDNLLTGIYYLRGYTKLMRNYGPQYYGYRLIRIVNPARGELLSTENNQHSSSQKMELVPAAVQAGILVSADKTLYAPREIISLTLQDDNNGTSGIRSLSLSVVPENTDSTIFTIKATEKLANPKMDYYPESHGLSISGKLTEAASLVPVKDKIVNLSIIGEGRDFMAVRTDSTGKFFFALPDYTGSRDLFLCAEKTDSTKLKIWVDNDFCTLPVHIPTPAFSLSETERESVLNMALNVQINSHFYTDTVKVKQIANIEKTAFYGKSTNVIYIDKYIQLPSLEEYFNELPSEVRVRKRKGESRIVVLGAREVSLYDPLVLVDWVAVDEPSKVLAVLPQNILRIEVLNEDYVKGGQTYGGIVSIISKKGDFAGIDLPSTGIFINFHFLDEKNCKEMVYDHVPQHPDTRNTLLWKPGITLGKGTTQKFELTAPDTPGIYNVVVEGVDLNGEVFSTSGIFEVKK